MQIKLPWKADLRDLTLDATPPSIDRAIVDAILSGRLRAGTRLGEQSLATLFAVSRTVSREALIRLEARGIVQVSARRGWFVIKPSFEEAQEAFAARRAIEKGVLTTVASIGPDVVAILREHIARERIAIGTADVEARSFLLGDFHVCLVEALGNRLLAETLRDLTARTVLISALYQSTHEASASCAEHEAIVDTIAAGDLDRAADLMVRHIGNVEAGLGDREQDDPLSDLRAALITPPGGS